MVLYHHSQPLLSRIKRWTFWDGPRLQDAVELKAEVVVKARGGVLLKDKRQLAAVGCRLSRRGLRRLLKVSLLAILLEHGESIMGELG